MTVYSKETDQNPAVKEFVSNFYKVTDTKPTKDADAYVDLYTSDARIILGPYKGNGTQEIFNVRQGLWANTAKTVHTIKNVSLVSEHALLLNGDVEFTSNDGKSFNVEWAAEMNFSPSSDPLKLQFYQVYIDSAPFK